MHLSAIVDKKYNDVWPEGQVSHSTRFSVVESEIRGDQLFFRNVSRKKIMYALPVPENDIHESEKRLL